MIRQHFNRLLHRSKPHLRWLWPWIFGSRDVLRWLPVQKIPVSSKYFGRPKGVYWKTDDYLASSAGRQGHHRRHEIYPAETIRLRLPTAPDGSEVHWKFHPNQVQNIPPAVVFALENARFWGYFGATILSADDFLLNDLSRDLRWGPEHKVFTKFKLPPCRRLAGTVAVLATAEAAANYWHWTFELLPKLHLLEKAGYPPDKVDFYLVNHTGLPYQLETLAELGIRPEQIIQTDTASHFEAERMLVIPVAAQLQIGKWACDFLRSRVRTSRSEHLTHRRIYISRAHCAFRRLTNENEVFAALREDGFEMVSCETLTTREQRQIFSEAEIVVAPHGAAMSNLVFCRANTRIVELFPPTYVDLSMWPHISHRDLHHTYLLGEAAVPPPGTDPMARTDNLTVSISELLSVVRESLAHQAARSIFAAN